MAIIKFRANYHNRCYAKALRAASPTIRDMCSPVKITIETDAQPTAEYMETLARMIEETPMSAKEHFTDVTPIG